MLRFLIHISWWIGSISCVLAQTTDSSHILEEVSVWALPYQKYASGSKVQHLDSTLIGQNATETIAKLLEKHTPLYFKEYGNGMLSSVAFRGTGASHTAVLWNGVNINSLSLGSLDFNLIPTILIENIGVQYGASSTLYGTDAVGGAVLLEGFQFDQIPLKQVHFGQSFGSFGKNFTALKLYYGKKKWKTIHKWYRTAIENDFEYQNITKIGFPIEIQRHASAFQQGFLQEIYFQPASTTNFSLKTWFQEAYRHIQPPMNSPTSQDFQQDRSWRMVLDFQQDFKKHFIYSKVSYTYDFLKFNDFSPSDIHRISWALGTEITLKPTLSLHTGTNFQHIQALIENYEQLRTENRYDAFLWVQWQFLKDWRMTANLRQAYVATQAAPFAPSWGIAGILWQSNTQKIALKANIGRHFKIPTLNDRYWQPGGNPDLESESGYSSEIGLDYQIKKNNWDFSLNATFYRLQVENWILWQPTGSFWSPMNVQEVLGQGFEWQSSFNYRNSYFYWQMGINYTFSQAIQQKAQSQYDRSQGKQLPYTPLHMANIFQEVRYKTYSIGLNANFTGARYILADNTDFLPSYWLWQISFQKYFILKKLELHTQLKINNLTNISYQNLAFRAMPLRHFEMILQLKF